jgi:hypothetical protein
MNNSGTSGRKKTGAVFPMGTAAPAKFPTQQVEMFPDT